MRLGHAITLVFLCLNAFGQSTFSSLTGTITDPTGAPIPGVQIEAVQTQTNYRYTATSDDSGNYTIPNINDGTYNVRAKATGFQEHRVESVVLTVREVRRVDIQMKLGSVDTIVEVTGGVTLIETETARIADVKDRMVLRSLPLTLRRAWDYFTLSPQVSKTTGGFQVRFAGSRQNQGEAVMDGTTVARSGGGFASGPLMDRTESFQELRLDIAGNSAEHSTMGQVSLISRSGANEIHGTFSDYYTTPAFLARNPFQSQRTGSVGHRFTYGFGGPVYFPKLYNGRNKTFFFTTIEMNGGSGGITAINQTVPLRTWRDGDFTGQPAIRDPFGGNTPFAGNRIPAARLNATARAIQERFFPQSNFGDTTQFFALNYRETRQNALAYQPNFTLRMDHRFSDKSFVYGRITKVDWNLNNFDGLALVKDRFTRSRTLRAATVAHTHSFTSAFLNEFRWGTSFDDLPGEPSVNGRQLVQDLGLRGLYSDLPDRGGLHQVSFIGLGISSLALLQSCGPCGWDRVQQFTDNVTWFRGKHQIKLGVAVQLGRARDRREGALFGATAYSNRYSGHPYADFLLGIPTTANRDFASIEQDGRTSTLGLYIANEWKVSPKFTLTYGLRYELKPGWREANGRQAIFDISSGNIVVPDGSVNLVSPLMPSGYVGVVEASKAGRHPSRLVAADKNNFAPRFGFAWRPIERTVLRGGYGIFFDTAARSPARAGVPFILNEPAFTNTDANPIVLPQVFPATAGGRPTTVGLPVAIRPDLRIPYSMQYTFTIERQQWDTGFRMTYTGTNTRQGVYRYDINQPIGDGNLYVDKPRMFPRYPGISYEVNGAGHQYHGVSIEAERRMRNGIHFQTYYTLQRDIGDLENGESPEDALDRRRERAAWGALPTHRWTGLMIYELPIGKGKPLFANAGRVANAVIGGWKISPIYIYETGNFITPLWTGPDPTGTRFTAGRNRPNVTIRPDHLRDASISTPGVNRWFDITAFAAPPVGRFGNSAKYVIKGVPVNTMHGSLAKEFTLKERVTTRLEILANNILNHPNYMEPNTVINAAGTAGVITAVMDRNAKFDSAITRVFQFQLRIEF